MAGSLVALAGGEWALAATAALFTCAGVAIFGVAEPAAKRNPGRVLRQAWTGLVYVLHNRTLSGLALTFFAYSVGWGGLVIAIPVLVLGRLHEGPATVGYLWGAVGAAGLVATLVVGRVRMQGRERVLMSVSIAAVAAAMVLLPFASSIAVVAVALVVIAVVTTPFDIAFLTLRQRRTDPSAFGRAFAVSVSLNMLGGPVGSAVAGPLIAWSLDGALWVAVVSTAVAALLPMLVIPARDEAVIAS